MNTHTLDTTSGDPSGHQRADMLTEVDFKWLMAGMGMWVDPQQLHHDPGYAHDSVQRALLTPCEPLHRCALALAAELENQDPQQG
jgi:hypothetical protein